MESDKKQGNSQSRRSIIIAEKQRTQVKGEPLTTVIEEVGVIASDENDELDIPGREVPGEVEQVEEVDLVDILENCREPIVFITGNAGTGKSSQIQRWVKTTRKRTLVTATTGIGAINCGGSTMHKTFRLPIGLPTKEDIKKSIQIQGGYIRKADVIIIDEVSMAQAWLIDLLDEVLRGKLRSKKPFGGIQLVMVGDPFQLPPVVKRDEWEIMEKQYETPFFFDAKVLRKHPPKTFQMTRVFRQSAGESRFLEILNKIRIGEKGVEVLNDLNARHRPDFGEPEGFVTLCATNAAVSAINEERLRRLAGDVSVYHAEIEGEFKKTDTIAEDILELKVGAQVMFLRNSQEQEYVNGTIGIVSRLNDFAISVRVNGKTIIVPQERWEKFSYSDAGGELHKKVIGVFTQFPLKLAWAATIHKSQGTTMDRCIIDPDRIFESGQLYVALSRCRTLGGVVLKNYVREKDVRVSEDVQLWWSNAIEEGIIEEVLQRFIGEKEDNAEESPLDIVKSGRFLELIDLGKAKELTGKDKEAFAIAAVDVLIDEVEKLRIQVDSLQIRTEE